MSDPTYYFSVANMTGRVWSPRQGTATGDLVGILEEIVRQVNTDCEILDLNPDLKERIVLFVGKCPVLVYLRDPDIE